MKKDFYLNKSFYSLVCHYRDKSVRKLQTSKQKNILSMECKQYHELTRDFLKNHSLDQIKEKQAEAIRCMFSSFQEAKDCALYCCKHGRLMLLNWLMYEQGASAMYSHSCISELVNEAVTYSQWHVVYWLQKKYEGVSSYCVSDHLKKEGICVDVNDKDSDVIIYAYWRDSDRDFNGCFSPMYVVHKPLSEIKAIWCQREYRVTKAEKRALVYYCCFKGRLKLLQWLAEQDLLPTKLKAKEVAAARDQKNNHIISWLHLMQRKLSFIGNASLEAMQSLGHYHATLTATQIYDAVMTGDSDGAPELNATELLEDYINGATLHQLQLRHEHYMNWLIMDENRVLPELVLRAIREGRLSVLKWLERHYVDCICFGDPVLLKAATEAAQWHVEEFLAHTNRDSITQNLKQCGAMLFGDGDTKQSFLDALCLYRAWKDSDYRSQIDATIDPKNTLLYDLGLDLKAIKQRHKKRAYNITTEVMGQLVEHAVYTGRAELLRFVKKSSDVHTVVLQPQTEETFANLIERRGYWHLLQLFRQDLDMTEFMSSFDLKKLLPTPADALICSIQQDPDVKSNDIELGLHNCWFTLKELKRVHEVKPFVVKQRNQISLYEYCFKEGREQLFKWIRDTFPCRNYKVHVCSSSVWAKHNRHWHMLYNVNSDNFGAVNELRREYPEMHDCSIEDIIHRKRRDCDPDYEDPVSSVHEAQHPQLPQPQQLCFEGRTFPEIKARYDSGEEDLLWNDEQHLWTLIEHCLQAGRLNLLHWICQRTERALKLILEKKNVVETIIFEQQQWHIAAWISNQGDEYEDFMEDYCIYEQIHVARGKNGPCIIGVSKAKKYQCLKDPDCKCMLSRAGLTQQCWD